MSKYARRSLLVTQTAHSPRVIPPTHLGFLLASRKLRALMMAVNLRKPPADLICHSDRGRQYASHDYQNLLKQHGM